MESQRRFVTGVPGRGSNDEIGGKLFPKVEAVDVDLSIIGGASEEGRLGRCEAQRPVVVPVGGLLLS